MSLRDELAHELRFPFTYNRESAKGAADAVLGSEALQSIRAELGHLAFMVATHCGEIDATDEEILSSSGLLSPSVVTWVMGDTP